MVSRWRQWERSDWDQSPTCLSECLLKPVVRMIPLSPSQTHLAGLAPWCPPPCLTSRPERGSTTLTCLSLQVVASKEPLLFQLMEKIVSGWQLMKLTGTALETFQMMMRLS